MIAELLSNPSMIHAAVVHLPIAAGVFGLIMIALSAVFHRNNTVRMIAALIYLVLVGSAWLAIETGEDARELVPAELPKAVWDQVSAHANGAQNVLYSGIFTLACLVLSLIRVDSVRIVTMLLAAVGGIVVNVFVAQTGHIGGALVYNEGLGTPYAHTRLTPPAPPAPPVVMPEPAPAEGVVPPSETVAPGTDPAAPIAPAAMEPAVDPQAAAVPADNPDWVPVRDFTMEEARLVSYTRDIWPIIDDQCIVCHENPDADGEYDMTTVANMLLGGKKGGPGVVPGKPDESAVVKYIRGIVNPRMPEDEPPLPEDMLHKIRMWIAAGAIDDSDASAAAAPVTEVPATAEVAPEVTAPEPVPATEMKDEAAPASEATPAAEAPASETTETPAPEATPAAEAPASEAAETPAAESTPAAETPASETT